MTELYRDIIYIPALGRFLQVDPVSGNLRYPDTFLSAYFYVANAPNRLLDPSGRLYGNWCGPFVYGQTTDLQTGEQYNSAEPVDELDRTCRSHDYAYSQSHIMSLNWDRSWDRVEADSRLFRDGFKKMLRPGNGGDFIKATVITVSATSIFLPYSASMLVGSFVYNVSKSVLGGLASIF